MRKKLFIIFMFFISIVSVKADIAVDSLATVGGNTRRVSIGDTVEIEPVYIIPSNATNKNLIWTSSNKNVATVNNDGIATGVDYGTATITATSESNPSSSISFELVVSNKVLFDANGGKFACSELIASASTPIFHVEDDILSIFGNKNDTIGSYFVDELPDTLSNITACEIKRNGYVFDGWEGPDGDYPLNTTFENIKTKTLTAKWVKDNIDISFEQQINCKPNETVKNLLIEVTGYNGAIEYKSSNKSVVTVTDSELQANCMGCRVVDVTCHDGGDAQIIITAGETKFRSDVQVSSVEAILSFMTTIRIGVGEKQVLPINVKPETEKYNIRFYSDNSKIVTVDEDRNLNSNSGDIGVIKGISVGKAKVRAEAMDNYNNKISLNVEVLNKKTFDSNGGVVSCNTLVSKSETPILTAKNNEVLIYGDNGEKISDFFGKEGNNSCKITKDGYELNGWYSEDSEGHFTYYNNSTKFEDIKSDKLYALWTKIDFVKEITCSPGETVKHLKIDMDSFPIYDYTFKSNDTSVATIKDSTDLQVKCINCK